MNKILIFSAALLAAILPASAVTLNGVITGLSSGIPSSGFTTVGVGTPVTFTFDLPNNPGSPVLISGGAGYNGAFYPLSASIVGAPQFLSGGFQFSILSGRFTIPATAGPDGVIAYGSVGNVGNPAAVFVRSMQFDDPTGQALQNAIQAQQASIPGVEAALQARLLNTGTLTLVDEVSFPGSGHEWAYTFTLVPEPSSLLLLAAGAGCVLRRRRGNSEG